MAIKMAQDKGFCHQAWKVITNPYKLSCVDQSSGVGVGEGAKVNSEHLGVPYFPFWTRAQAAHAFTNANTSAQLKMVPTVHFPLLIVLSRLDEKDLIFQSFEKTFFTR